MVDNSANAESTSRAEWHAKDEVNKRNASCDVCLFSRRVSGQRWNFTIFEIFFLSLIFSYLSSILGIRFGQLIHDDASYNSNLVGLALSIVFVTTHYYYSTPSEKATTMKMLVYSGVFTVVVLLYSKVFYNFFIPTIHWSHFTIPMWQYEDAEKVPHRFGLIFTGLFYIFFIFPILDTIKTLKLKCTQHLPFPMIVSGTAVGLSWLLHGIVIKSGVIVVRKFDKFAFNWWAFSPSLHASPFSRFKMQ